MRKTDFYLMREKMVDEQLIARGISFENVLSAFKKVPRHEFVGEDEQENAYSDFPLPIGESQTISQPYIVALMTELLELKKTYKVLEIGTGSGYQAAILAELASEVYTVERFERLAKSAEEVLAKLGYNNIKIKVGDGSLGWEEYAPYDGIVVTAGAPDIPKHLVSQLKDGARLVAPIGAHYSQILTVIKKFKGKIDIAEVCGCIFVPLVGEEGWGN